MSDAKRDVNHRNIPGIGFIGRQKQRRIERGNVGIGRLAFQKCRAGWLALWSVLCLIWFYVSILRTVDGMATWKLPSKKDAL